MGISNFGALVQCSALSKTPFLDHSGIKESLSKETGRERVLRMFQKNEIGIISPELRYVIQSGTTILFLAGFCGGMVSWKKARDDFFRKTMASTFESEYKAKRSLLDTMTIAAFRGAYKYALQYGTFGSLYLLSTMTIENYRNKISIWEHMGTAAVLGGLSRLKYGVKGVLVASMLGAFLGSVAGGIVMLNMKLSGYSFEDFRYWQHEYYYTKMLKRKVE